MISLEDVDPELIDQTIRQLLAKDRSPAREAAICQHLGDSRELSEWVVMIIDGNPPPTNDPRTAALARLMAAVALGLEIGYELGTREATRERKTCGS
jgi:hypothetical protein